ncbi:MAG: response regulator [Nitrospirae bacterium]|nr:response regulator [Nitrospirota bacterium]
MKKLKVLVIDDVAEMRLLIKSFLKMSFPDIEMDLVSSGKDALSKIQVNTYDVVLCDWEMPEMNGDEILKWMKEQDGIKDIPFIMVTAHNEKEYILNAMKLGVTDYIIKPFTAEIIGNKISGVVKK